MRFPNRASIWKRRAWPDSAEYLPTIMGWRARLGPALKRRLVPETSVRRRWWWNRVFIQVNKPFFYADDDRDSIYAKLQPAATRSEDVLAEAQAVFERDVERREHVERRATTLQGAVAIAFAFALAGGALILDVEKLPATEWRVAVGVVYVGTVLSLVATASRSLRATVRVHRWQAIDPREVVARAGVPGAESNLRRASEFLFVYSRNQPIVDYQVTQMRAAGHWLGLAVVTLLVCSVLVFAAQIDRDPSSEPRAKTSRTPATIQLERRVANAERHVTAANAEIRDLRRQMKRALVGQPPHRSRP